MPNAAIRRLQRTAFDHPLARADDALTEQHYLRVSGGVSIGLSLNK